MNMKSVKALFFSALCILALFTATMAFTCHERSKIKTQDYDIDSIQNTQNPMLCGGDDVGGGGWPNSGNQTGNLTG